MNRTLLIIFSYLIILFGVPLVVYLFFSYIEVLFDVYNIPKELKIGVIIITTCYLVTNQFVDLEFEDKYLLKHFEK